LDLLDDRAGISYINVQINIRKMGKRSGPVAVSQRDNTRDLVRRVNSTEDIEEILELTKSPYPEVRVAAVRQICPCQVFDKVDEFWERS
jgi:hypothetical protein